MFIRLWIYQQSLYIDPKTIQQKEFVGQLKN